MSGMLFRSCAVRPEGCQKTIPLRPCIRTPCLPIARRLGQCIEKPAWQGTVSGCLHLDHLTSRRTLQATAKAYVSPHPTGCFLDALAWLATSVTKDKLECQEICVVEIVCEKCTLPVVNQPLWVTKLWPNHPRPPTPSNLATKSWGGFLDDLLLLRKRRPICSKGASRSLVSPKLGGLVCPPEPTSPQSPPPHSAPLRSLSASWLLLSGTSPQGPSLPSFSSAHHPSPLVNPKELTLNPPTLSNLAPKSNHEFFFSPLPCLTPRSDDPGIARARSCLLDSHQERYQRFSSTNLLIFHNGGYVAILHKAARAHPAPPCDVSLLRFAVTKC